MVTKNLFIQLAKNKIKELSESIDFTLKATNLSSVLTHAIPMSTKKWTVMANMVFKQ